MDRLKMDENDRYIPNRDNVDFETSHLLINRTDSYIRNMSKKYQLFTNQNMSKLKVLRSRVRLDYKTMGTPKDAFKPLTKDERRLRTYPVDVLPAYNANPDFFRSNTLDLSCKNMNALALDNYVFIWDLNTNTYLSYERNRSTPLVSLCWDPNGTRLAISKKNHLDILGGAEVDLIVRRVFLEDKTYCSMNWRNALLSCGTFRSEVDSYDLRSSSKIPIVTVRTGGKGNSKNPVVNIKWSPNGKYLATSDPSYGIQIWDVLNMKIPLHSFRKHVSTCKGLAWCPYQRNSLASGGGFFDGKVYVWNCNNGRICDSVSIDAQITGLIWSETDRELLTSHARRTINSVEDKYPASRFLFWKYAPKAAASTQLKKLTHSLCNTEPVISVTSNGRYLIALCDFDTPKLYLWENIFTAHRVLHTLNDHQMESVLKI